MLRRKFANGLTNPQLVAVPARSRGDQCPDQWQPPLYSCWSTYGRTWDHVKYVFHLDITEPQKNELGEMLDTCDA
ncbi:hypothetical protein AB0D11_42260 [Streptomyces monashensis]|uniref:hypothetical protein n=1 Tax=Streptomyces monashensis TaxID=1678012 RepID=UPI00340E8158